MRSLFLLVPVTLLFIGCSQKSEKIETKHPVLFSSNNTEVEEWTNLYNIKKDENAHSGAAIAFVDSLTVYSVGYSRPLSTLGKTKVDSVIFSYWAFVKNDKAAAKTVLTISDPAAAGKNIVWVGNPLKNKVKEYGKWVEVTETFKIPATIDRKYLLMLYVMNTSKEEILLDDFKVAFY